MTKDYITGFEFPVFDSEGKIESTELRLYDYNSLANIPNHEEHVSMTSGKYTIDNDVHVEGNLEVSSNVHIDGRSEFNGEIILSTNSFGDNLPTEDEHVVGRLFFVKLQD